MSDPRWTDQQLDRFTAAEICIDELMQINDEFPGFFPPLLVRALSVAQRRDPFCGFADEAPGSRHARLLDVRGRLQAAFPCRHRTQDEAEAEILRRPALKEIGS
jgi:hypothetical protein